MKEWCIPKAGAEFVAAMEDVLEVYQRPYDPLRPVVCIDETNKQLIKETRTAEDFAQILKYTYDVLYPRTEKIVPVTDHLNTHTTASLYKHLSQKKHAGWQNGLNGIIHQNMGAGSTWLKLK